MVHYYGYSYSGSNSIRTVQTKKEMGKARSRCINDRSKALSEAGRLMSQRRERRSVDEQIRLWMKLVVVLWRSQYNICHVTSLVTDS